MALPRVVQGILITSGALIAIGAAAFAMGPRPSLDPAVQPPPLPDDLEALETYLSGSEAHFEDITPGAEKVIRWADSSHTRTPLAVVYLHGFSATRQESAPLPDSVASRLGANLYYTRLTGHGRPGDALGEATATDWLRDAREALAIGRRLGDGVLLIGASTGGTLATWLAAQPNAARDLAGLILLSPNFAPKDASTRFLLWPWGEQIARAAVGTHREWEPSSEAQGRYWTTRYPSGALVHMMKLVELVEAIDLAQVTVPTLVLYDEKDDVISVDAAKRRFEDIGAARKMMERVEGVTDPSHHILAGRIQSPETTEPLAERIVRFVKHSGAATTETPE